MLRTTIPHLRQTRSHQQEFITSRRIPEDQIEDDDDTDTFTATFAAFDGFARQWSIKQDTGH
jgi:hypothetical protein